MTHKQRYAAKADKNQKGIVEQLRSLGCSVAYGHDDILVGYQGKTYWFEVKDPEKLLCKDGVTFRKGAVTPAQTKLRSTWRGHYAIIWELEQILEIIGHGARKQTR